MRGGFAAAHSLPIHQKPGGEELRFGGCCGLTSEQEVHGDKGAAAKAAALCAAALPPRVPADITYL